MAISIQEHGSLMTTKVVEKFKEIIPVRSGFGSVFPRETTPTYYVDVMVQRGSRKIAPDVQMYTEGVKTKQSKLSIKKFEPPFFKLEYNFRNDDAFINAMVLGALSNPIANKAIRAAAVDGVKENKNLIERSIAKQQADVLQTGIVSLISGDNIDYKRKAESMNVLSGVDLWSAPTTATPIADLTAGVKFLRETGNSGSSKVNCFMSELAFDYFLKTTEVKNYADFRRVERLDIKMPEWNEASGMTFQGRVGAGALVLDIYTYNELYEEFDNESTHYYLDQENVILLPDDFQGKTVFAALPALEEGSIVGTTTMIPTVIETDYLIRPYYNERTIDSGIELTSRPLVVPTTIDKIYTAKVL
jgi:hypothetical protein